MSGDHRETREMGSVARQGSGERAQPRPRFASAALFGSAREIVIEHAGHEYRLRVTSNDKLILTK